MIGYLKPVKRQEEFLLLGSFNASTMLTYNE